MLSVAEAQSKILAAVRPLEPVPLALADAGGRWLAEDIAAPLDLPPFDNSAMDGYAVRAADTTGAAEDSPATLNNVGVIPAGSFSDATLQPGQCIRIFTGSPLPKGADAVVMQEDCRVDAAQPARIAVLCPVTPWENVRFAGEDVRKASLVCATGDALTPGRLALLAALGIGNVTVRRAPRVALLSTGSELCAPGTPLAPGKIFESNRVALAALAHACGAEPRLILVAADDDSTLRAALEAAFDGVDVVVTTGGVSVGEFDRVKAVFAELGGRTEFWKVSVKPGKPLVFGERGGALFFGLPGNPVSALAGMTLFVLPALRKLAGARAVFPPPHHARLAEPVSNTGNRPHFVRVTLDADGLARVAGAQASHILSGAADADGLVEVPAGATLAAGSAVRVLPWS